jgi:hypothetical protein
MIFERAAAGLLFMRDLHTQRCNPKFEAIARAASISLQQSECASQPHTGTVWFGLGPLA